MIIVPYEKHDEAIWIPVAKGKKGGPARAFLPFLGVRGLYTFGFKASPSRAPYFQAVSEIQRAHTNGESESFLVNGGKRRELQRKARWRDGNREGSPLLSPTLGWVLVPVSELETISSADLEKALVESGDGHAVISPETIAPVLCENSEKLERESSRLLREPSLGKPAGQASPKRMPSLTEQFERDAKVCAYVLREADGRCECCMQPAPFRKPDGLPYLEVHHVRTLASGGSDRISNAVAVCPNCHRELHHGRKSKALAEGLYDRIERLAKE